MCFYQIYVGYVHAVAHSLGGKYNIPHGLANATILPMVLEDYGSTIYKSFTNLLFMQVLLTNPMIMQ